MLEKIYTGIQKHGCGFDEEFRLPDELKDTESYSEPNQELIDKYGCSNWYEWNVSTLGTKWDMLEPLEDGSIDEENVGPFELVGNQINIGFDSPWNGPFIWFHRVCKKYNLSGVMIDAESGCDFFSKTVFKDGTIIEVCDARYFSKPAIEHFGIEEFAYEIKSELIDYRSLEDLKSEDLELYEFLKSYLSDDALSEIIEDINSELNEDSITHSSVA